MKQSVLLVDDEPDILELLSLTVERMSLKPVQASSVAQALSSLRQQRFDLCLTDLRLPDGDGIEVVEDIQKQFPDLPVAVISAHGNMQTAIEAMKAGAFDFVSKPIDLNQLRTLIEGALSLQQDDTSGRTSVEITPRLLGVSAKIERIREQVNKLSRSMAPVHIRGESGTGKELVARLIHDSGARRQAPFIAVNCSAIPAELMESEFFGHRKGSFTGASRDHPGLFSAADGGTLFLDEIAELPMPMQAKLLRAIQERAVRPVGSHEEVPVNTRILSATHQDLQALVDQGRFREDLYYRIKVIELEIPPLRERKEDVDLLIEMILGHVAERNQSPALEIEPAAIEALHDYPFPGNIRELENILERAATLCDNDRIRIADLSLPAAKADASRPGIDADESLDDYLARIERGLIEQALIDNDNNKTRAAESLGISFRSLRYKLKKLGID